MDITRQVHAANGIVSPNGASQLGPQSVVALDKKLARSAKYFL
jgi:hypothetical protein